MQPAPFQLNCLGIPRLLTPGGQEVRVKVKKHLALLVILAVDGGKIRRERLVSLLWPTARPDRARGSVATAISFLRAKLGGDAMEPARDWVQLRRGHVKLDLDRLTAGEIIGDDFTPPLEVDAFLAGFEIDQVPEFDEWRERQHARLLPAVEQGLVALADHARRSGDLHGLGHHADRLLQLNDLSEAGIKARMEAYALSGDRITAIRVFDDWVERLRTEVKASPSRSLEDLANRLRHRGWERPSSEPRVAAVHTEQWRNQHFIGRSAEYRRLYELWEQNKRGETRHVLIKGDSGVGKTTLADRFTTALSLEGASTARVRCFGLESSIPFATIGALLEALLDRPGAAATGPESLAELAKILPEVRRRFPALPVATDSVGEQARIRFADAAHEFLCAVAEEHPVMLVVDDFDRSDEVSLGILHMLVRRLVHAPIMLVLTTRTGAQAERYEFRRLRTGIEDLGIEILDVEPLGAEEGEMLFDALTNELGLRPSTSERRTLLRASGGFPLAIELTLRDWQVHGSRSIAFAIPAITTEVQAHPEARYQQLTESLLADLGDSERVVVHVAAVLDRRVGDLKLYQIAGLQQATTLAALSRMLERRALRDTPTGLEWINPAVRAHAYLAVPASMRVALHDGIFAELESRCLAGGKVPGLELAWHAVRAGRSREGSLYLLSGAREAILAGAARDAEIALTSGMDSLGEPVRRDAVLCLAQIFLELGRPGEAVDIVQPLIGASDESGTMATLLQLTGLVQGQKARPTLGESEHASSVLYSIALQSRDPCLRARAVATCMELHVNEPTESSRRLVELGLEIPVSELPPAEATGLLGSLAKHYYRARDLARCEELLTHAVRLADDSGLRNIDYLRALNGLGVISCANGNYKAGLERSIRLHVAAEATGHDGYVTTAAANVALCQLRLGCYYEAIDWTKRLRAYPSVCLADQVSTLEVEALASGMTGNRPRAGAIAAEAMRLATVEDEPWGIRRSLLVAADARFIAGEFEKATATAKLAINVGSPLQDDPAVTGRYFRWVAALELRSETACRTTAKRLREALASRTDAIDSVELLGGLSVLGLITPEESLELEALLTGLPHAVREQLSVLGAFGRQPVGGQGATERTSMAPRLASTAP